MSFWGSFRLPFSPCLSSLSLDLALALFPIVYVHAGNTPVFGVESVVPSSTRHIELAQREGNDEERVWMVGEARERGRRGERDCTTSSLPSSSFPPQLPASPLLCTTIRTPAAAAATASIWPLAFVGASSTAAAIE